MNRFKKGNMTKNELDEYVNFLKEVEEHRAIERDAIFEHAKSLSFGFKL